eukprot:11712071-Alexandrium_andersonii.AAC.1
MQLVLACRANGQELLCRILCCAAALCLQGDGALRGCTGFARQCAINVLRSVAPRGPGRREKRYAAAAGLLAPSRRVPTATVSGGG